MSPKTQMPKKVCRTPRTAGWRDVRHCDLGTIVEKGSPAEIMWETGEVTLMLKNPAMQMRNPKTPCEGASQLSARAHDSGQPTLTVTAAPVKKIGRAHV